MDPALFAKLENVEWDDGFILPPKVTYTNPINANSDYLVKGVFRDTVGARGNAPSGLNDVFDSGKENYGSSTKAYSRLNADQGIHGQGRQFYALDPTKSVDDRPLPSLVNQSLEHKS